MATRVASRRPRGGLYTVGYQGRSQDSYLALLREHGVSVLCDVRRNPLSRKPGFSKKTLARGCASVGIRYQHLPELGIASAERRGLTTQTDYDALFARYERDWLPQQGEALATIAGWVRAGERVAMTCFELLPQQCHRHRVAAALEAAYGRALRARHI